MKCTEYDIYVHSMRYTEYELNKIGSISYTEYEVYRV